MAMDAFIQTDPYRQGRREVASAPTPVQPGKRSHEEAEGRRGIEEPRRPRGVRRDRLSGGQDPRRNTNQRPRADMHPSQDEEEGGVGPEPAVRYGVTLWHRLAILSVGSVWHVARRASRSVPGRC